MMPLDEPRNRPAREGRSKARQNQQVNRRGKKGQSPRQGGQASLYEEVTRRIIGELEAGRVPWVKPWDESKCGMADMPRNAVSQRRYSGINILLLWRAMIERNWSSHLWLTYKQACEAGGQVRRGETGTVIFFAHRFTPKDPTSAVVRATKQGEAQAEQRSIPFLKRFTVFNLDQCDGLGALTAALPEPIAPEAIIPIAETLIAASGVTMMTGGTQASYWPALDRILMPPRYAFADKYDWYRTALHELTHATGHQTRLARDLNHLFGSPGYAREELVAEMGSAFLSASLGFAPVLHHADYLAAWLGVLRADSRAIFRAASAASKGCDWLLDRLDERSPDPDRPVPSSLVHSDIATIKASRSRIATGQPLHSGQGPDRP